MKPELSESPSRLQAAIVGGARAEEAARAMPASEVPVSSLLDAFPVLMWATTPDGVPCYLNQMCIEYTGWSLSDCLRLGWGNLIHPEDREEMLRVWSHAVQNGSSYHVKSRLRRADGEYRWFLTRGEPLRDREGRPIQFLGLSVDINESVKREAEIRRLFDANIVGIVFWDLDGGIRDANDAFLRMVGYERADLASGRLRWPDLTPPEWLQRDRELVEARVRLTGSVQPYEKEFFRKDGSRVPVLIGGAAFDEEIKCGVAFVVDITERKRAALSLADSEARFRNLTEISSDFYWETDAEHRYSSIEFGEAYVGTRDLSFKLGRARWEIPSPSPDEAGWAAHRAVLAARQRFFDFGFSRIENGKQRFYEISGDPRYDAGGGFLGYRGVGRDVTERRRAELALRRSQHYLAEAQKVSHTGSWAWSPVSNTILYWSEECYRILGYDPAQGPPSFESSFERVHPEDRPMLAETIERALREKAEFQIEYRLVLPEGTRRNVRILAHPVLDAAGKLVEFVGTVVDVTEQKRARQERHAHLWFLQSMDRINRAMQRSNDVELMTSGVMQEALEIFACDRAVLTYPCDPDTPAYRTVMEHTSPEYDGDLTLGQDRPSTPEWAELMRRALHHPEAVVDPRLSPGRREQFRIGSLLAIAVSPRGDRPYLFVVHCARSRPWTAAELRLFEETARRLGDALTSVLAHRNLLAREEQLRRSQHYLAEAQRLSHIGSWAFNADGFGHWSPELFEIHGLDPAGKAPSIPEYLALVHPEDREFVVREIQRMLASGEGFDFTKRIVRPGGAIRHVRCVGVRANTGEIGREFIGTGIDVTELKRAEDERKEHLWFLESMDRINRAMQRTNDVEGMMSGVLDETLAIFGCDRAWLVYPCDPRAATCRAVMEHTRPEYPGAFALGEELPVDTQTAEALQRVLDGPGAVTDLNVPAEVRERFSIQSIIAIAVRPKGDRPYLFGLHQCSHARAWTAAERRLFEEIARRLEGALTSVLAHRNLLASQEELRASEARFRALTELSSDWYWEQDENLRFTYTSRQLGETSSYPSDWVIGKTRWELAGITPLSFTWPEHQAVLAARQPFRDLEYARAGLDGVHYVSVSGAPVFDEEGVFRGYQGIGRDITERRRVQEALRTSEERYARAMEGSDAGHWDWNPVSDEMFVSQLAREMLALPDGPLPARRDEIMALVPQHPDDRALMPEEIEAGIESGSLEREYRVIPRPGEVRWLRSRGKVFRDPQGRPVRLTGSLLDITDRKVAADALRDARERLAQASKIASLAELSASIAHEINQPLQAILANGHASVRWLDATPPNIEKAIRTAQRVVRDGKAAADVVARIRALFKHTAPAKVDLDLNKLILEVRTLMSAEIQDNAVSFEASLGEDVPRIKADAVQIQQVIVNLARNAIEAMAQAPRKSLLIRSRRSEGRVVVDVRDQGTGLVDPEKIFEPFVSTKATGMGMGLTICRSIIEAHRGSIWVLRNEGPGVTFSFSLPLEASEAT